MDMQVHAYFRHGDRTPTPLGQATARAKLWESRLQEVPSALKDKEYFPQKYPWGLLTTRGLSLFAFSRLSGSSNKTHSIACMSLLFTSALFLKCLFLLY